MSGRTRWIITIALVIVVLVPLLLVGGLLAGRFTARWAAAASPMGWGRPGMMGPAWGAAGPVSWNDQGTPAGSCGYAGGGAACSPAGPAAPPAGGCSFAGSGANPPRSGQALTLDEARSAVERYVAAYGNTDLAVHEVMEFERNFYAVVEEESTGIGAFEVLVDRQSGAVRPEPGPNMMWNARYGMMGGRGMMGGSYRTGAMLLSPEEARARAQAWLDQNLPGVQARPDDVDPFYGYYTLHLWQDGQIAGMLSVHGETGEIWYHSWHGSFLAAVEEEG